ncbi:hypothetical protein [Streptomyces sp. DT203]|uniref:hypothetical protein n=1 Tax=Streptomyces sp. DT203 TaxID=3393424 RepID=UPI003CECF6E0
MTAFGQDALRFFADAFLAMLFFAVAVFFAGTVFFAAGFLLGRISCTVASPACSQRLFPAASTEAFRAAIRSTTSVGREADRSAGEGTDPREVGAQPGHRP